MFAEGLPILILGAVLSTVKVVEAADEGAVLPALSLAVPKAIEMPNVPFPVAPEIVTVRVVPVPDDTLTVPLAVPVLFKVILPVLSKLALKLASA